MKQILISFTFIFSLISCNNSESLQESMVLAAKFFNNNMPDEVIIPTKIKGSTHDKYRVKKFDFTFENNEVKIFYTINKSGKIGSMYVDGLNMNTGNTAIPLKRDEFIERIAACPTVQCIIKVYQDSVSDCMIHKNAEHCWYCQKYGGVESSGTWGCP